MEKIGLTAEDMGLDFEKQLTENERMKAIAEYLKEQPPT